MKKNRGIQRNIDELGRVVIPIEFRKTLNIKEGDPLEIMMKGNDIIVRRPDDACAFCGKKYAGYTIMGLNVCDDCKRKLKDELL